MTLNLRELRLKVDEHELEGFEYLWQQHLDTVEVDTQQVTAVEEDASQHLTAAALQVKKNAPPPTHKFIHIACVENTHINMQN